MNIEYLEAMQIKVTNASNNPINNSLTIFDTENIQKNNYSLFEPKNITFDPKISLLVIF